MATSTATKMGETWDMISYRIYGDELFVSELMSANTAYSTVVRFPYGVTIACPDVVTASAQDKLPPWKRK